MTLLSELRRRNIFRVALLYIVGAWLVLEISALGVDYAGIPDWVYRFNFAILIIGFPLALVFSWIFEITPQGIRREFEVDPDASITGDTGRKLLLFTLLIVLTITALTLIRFLLD